MAPLKTAEANCFNFDELNTFGMSISCKEYVLLLKGRKCKGKSNK